MATTPVSQFPRERNMSDLDLVDGTGVGGPAADGAAQELGTVTGAVATPLPGDHVVPGVRSTPPLQDPQRGGDRPGQGLDLRVAQRVRGSGGIDAGPEQRLVRQQVAEPGDAGLV